MIVLVFSVVLYFTFACLRIASEVPNFAGILSILNLNRYLLLWFIVCNLVHVMKLAEILLTSGFPSFLFVCIH